jgi:predicted  nucleic acid-binding Zn-ribbon protein
MKIGDIMPFIPKLLECSECGTILDTDDENGLLLPCKDCGATTSKANTDIKQSIIFKIKPAGATGDPELKIKIADDFHKDTKKWRQLKMSIDKTNNIYEKTVIDPNTDEVLYHNQEPLSSHTGRGSEKKKRDKRAAEETK